MSGLWRMVRDWWKLWVVIFTPLLLLPLPLVVNTPPGRTAYVLFIMAVFWITEALPIGVTSLLPVFLFPVLGIMTADVVAKSYISDLLMLFLGGLMVAVAIERWNLHRRIALGILLLVGSQPRWLMMGMMLATWFLSMWISNTATTAMMIPITEAILQQLKGPLMGGSSAEEGEEVKVAVENEKTESGSGNEDKTKGTPGGEGPAAEVRAPEATRVQQRDFDRLCKGMSLSICYAANCGGIATLTGTGPNLVLKERTDILYAENGLKSPINFASWMGFGFPLSALVLVVCWIWLQIAFLRCRGLTECCAKSDDTRAQGQRVRAVVVAEFKKLGPVSFAEGAVLFWFVALVVLWISRDLGGVGGWGNAFREEYVSDATAAIFIGISLFFFPSRLPWRRSGDDYRLDAESGDDSEMRPLLLWPEAQKKIPWGLILLLGGGFALSNGCKASGLSAWMGTQLEVLADIDKVGMLFILCILTATMTEVTSNTAISILLIPILTSLALKTGVHPLNYTIPATISCSFAFMLPVATPPNAIVFSYGHVKVIDMMLAGVVMNLLAVPLLVMAVMTWGDAMFDFQNIPAIFLNATSAGTSSQ